MPFKNKEEYNEYMRRYRARKNANWRNIEPEPEKFPELEAYSDAFRKPINLYENFGENKKGMIIVCSFCGTPLNGGHCPRCEPQPDD